MNVTQELLEQIDQYLEGSLSGNTLKAFEDRLQSDTALNALVEEQKIIITSIKKRELADVRKKIVSFHDELNSEDKVSNSTPSESIERTLPKRNPISKWLLVAASLLLLVGSYFMFFANGNNKSQDIAKGVEGQEELVASAGKYKKISVKNKAGKVNGEINLLITPSKKDDLQYTLSKDLLVLFINKERIPSLESISFFEEELPLSYFLQIEGKYYKLIETTQPTNAEETDFKE